MPSGAERMLPEEVRGLSAPTLRIEDVMTGRGISPPEISNRVSWPRYSPLPGLRFNTGTVGMRFWSVTYRCRGVDDVEAAVRTSRLVSGGVSPLVGGIPRQVTVHC